MSNLPPSVLTREVAAILRAARARRNVTQAELAKAAEVSQSQVSKMLLGSRPITVDQLDLMCQALRIDIVDVLVEADRETRGRAGVTEEVSAEEYARREVQAMRAEGTLKSGESDDTPGQRPA